MVTTQLDTKALEALHAGLRGSLVTPGNPLYDEARKVFNAMIDKRPAMIARCANTADVVTAVNFARENRLTVAVRAGGGVLWGEIDAATQEHALHTPGGRVTTTGIGGFTTGGGYGWTSSKYGLACDNLISAEVGLDRKST